MSLRVGANPSNANVTMQFFSSSSSSGVNTPFHPLCLISTPFFSLAACSCNTVLRILNYFSKSRNGVSKNKFGTKINIKSKTFSF